MPTKHLTESEAEVYGRQLVELLKEYAGKIERWISEIKRIRTQGRGDLYLNHPERTAMEMQLRALFPSITNLTRESSQLAEQGKINDATRIELKTRRAEVEGLMQAASSLLMDRN